MGILNGLAPGLAGFGKGLAEVGKQATDYLDATGLANQRNEQENHRDAVANQFRIEAEQRAPAVAGATTRATATATHDVSVEAQQAQAARIAAAQAPLNEPSAMLKSINSKKPAAAQYKTLDEVPEGERTAQMEENWKQAAISSGAIDPKDILNNQTREMHWQLLAQIQSNKAETALAVKQMTIDLQRELGNARAGNQEASQTRLAALGMMTDFRGRSADATRQIADNNKVLRDIAATPEDKAAAKAENARLEKQKGYYDSAADGVAKTLGFNMPEVPKEAPAAATEPPAAAIEALRKNPNLAADFKAKYKVDPTQYLSAAKAGILDTPAVEAPGRAAHTPEDYISAARGGYRVEAPERSPLKKANGVYQTREAARAAIEAAQPQ